MVHAVVYNNGQLCVAHVNPEDNKLEIDFPEMEEDIQVSDLGNWCLNYLNIYKCTRIEWVTNPQNATRCNGCIHYYLDHKSVHSQIYSILFNFLTDKTPRCSALNGHRRRTNR